MVSRTLVALQVLTLGAVLTFTMLIPVDDPIVATTLLLVATIASFYALQAFTLRFLPATVLPIVLVVVAGTYQGSLFALRSTEQDSAQAQTIANVTFGECTLYRNDSHNICLPYYGFYSLNETLTGTVDQSQEVLELFSNIEGTLIQAIGEDTTAWETCVPVSLIVMHVLKLFSTLCR